MNQTLAESSPPNARPQGHPRKDLALCLSGSHSASASAIAAFSPGHLARTGRASRAGRSWFSYDVPVEDGHPMVLIATYYSADRRTSPATFDILVDGERLAEQKVERTDPGHFYDVSYPLSAAMVQGKS